MKIFWILIYNFNKKYKIFQNHNWIAKIGFHKIFRISSSAKCSFAKLRKYLNLRYLPEDESSFSFLGNLDVPQIYTMRYIYFFQFSRYAHSNNPSCASTGTTSRDVESKLKPDIRKIIAMINKLIFNYTQEKRLFHILLSMEVQYKSP